MHEYVSARRLLYFPNAEFLWLLSGTGTRSRARFTFSGCRQYSVESLVSFDDFDSTCQGKSAKGSPANATLPERFEVELTLEDDVESEVAAVGDPVTARLQGSIERDGEIVIPKGTLLHGRISRLPLIDGHRYIDFRFAYFDLNGTPINIDARLNEIEVSNSWYQGVKNRANLGGLSLRFPTPIPGEGSRVHLQRGYRLFLRSIAGDTPK
jgi:hypothetical protein